MNKAMIGVLRQKKKQILTLWMKNQLAEDGPHDDLMSTTELRTQSEELLNTLLETLSDESFAPLPPTSGPLYALLSDISQSRARQGFTPAKRAFISLA